MKKGFIFIVFMTLASTAGNLYATGTLWSEVQDNVAYVHHNDAWFNCCPEFVTWSEHDSIDYHIVNIYELDTLHLCNCTCFYDFDYVFYGLEAGNYKALVWEAPYEQFELTDSTEFIIPIKTGSPWASGSVSECHQEPGVKESPSADGVGFATVSVSTFEIRYSLMGPSRVTIAIFDVAGRKIRTFDEGMIGQGEHSITWDCRDDRGVSLSRGVYFVRLATQESLKNLPFIVLK